MVSSAVWLVSARVVLFFAYLVLVIVIAPFAALYEAVRQGWVALEARMRRPAEERKRAAQRGLEATRAEAMRRTAEQQQAVFRVQRAAQDARYERMLREGNGYLTVDGYRPLNGPSTDGARSMDRDAMRHMREAMAELSLEQLAERMHMPVERLAALESGGVALDFSEAEEHLFYRVIDDEVRRLSSRPGTVHPIRAARSR